MPCGRQLEVVEVGPMAVAGADVGDLVVGGVGDHVFAGAEPVHRDVALPPGEHLFARVFLGLEVRRRGVAGQGLEPHQPPGGVEDHRPGLAGAAVGRDEHLAGRDRRGVRGDRDRRRPKVRPRAEALFLRGTAGVDPLRCAADAVGAGDAEHVQDPPPHAPDPGPRVDRHALAFGERLCGQEARPVALGVGREATRMPPAAGAAHGLDGQIPGRYAEEADLRLRRCVPAARQGR